MSRARLCVACLVMVLPLSVTAQNLQDHLTFKAEMSADPYTLRLGSLPQDLIENVVSRGIDLRHQVLYDAPRHQLSLRTFLVSPGSPKPTSLLVVQNNEVEGFRADVTDIVIDEASRTVTFHGFVAGGYRSPVHEAYEGAAFRLSATYRAGPITSFDRTVVTVDSVVVMSSYDGLGTLVIEEAPNRAPVPKVGPPLVQSFMTEVMLNAGESYDEDGEELDYKWHVTAGAAALRGCETATPILQLMQGQASYEVRLTVTDSRGASSYDYVRIISSR